jgi:hypothetical protein
MARPSIGAQFRKKSFVTIVFFLLWWDPRTKMDLRTWFLSQYEREYMTRYSLSKAAKARDYRTLYGYQSWRLDKDISVWSCITGETIPTTWDSKPTAATVRKLARDAWSSVDDVKVDELRAKWEHDCKDPYYCRMHGFGSN